MTAASASDDDLQRARALERRDPAEAGRLYARVLHDDPASIEANNALERLGDPARYSAWMRVNCMLHPDDDIFRFFARQPCNLNPIRDYLADGWRTLSELMVLMERLDRPLVHVDSVLEFACGFGRFTRHLARLLPGRVTGSDVVPEAVTFVREQFGVDTFPSSFRPREIEFPRRYELVFVLSLFTHLPVSAWGDWLRALARATQPGGLLVFSVHNEDTAAELGAEFDDSGTFFTASSESPVLDPELYGTTFTTRAVVERELQAALGREATLYQPLAFWVGQDAVAVRIGE